MKKTRTNPYATNAGGKIDAMFETAQPSASVIRGKDLRAGR